MGPRPVDAYPEPDYPTRAEAASDPALLRDHLPAGWRQPGAMAGVVAFFMAFAGAGCHGASGATTPGPGGEAGEGSGPVVPIAPAPAGAVAAGDAPGATDAPPGPEAMKVAPIFEHGDGRGAVGCVVVSPPVFLSEDEAFAVVREELAKSGIELDQRAVPLPGLVISKTTDEYSRGPNGDLVRKTVELPGSGKPLTLDGVSRKRRVAVEIVSEADYFELGGAHSSSSVQSYDLKERAAFVADKLRTQGKEPLYVGVFYDPAGFVEWNRGQQGPMPDFEVMRRIQADKSKELLRAQVRDFVSWIRGKTSLL